MPFEYVVERVPYERAKARELRIKERFWIFQRPRPALRTAVSGLSRYILTPESSEHRLFCWADAHVLPVGSLFAIAREDDASFGILHSRIHEIWSTAQGNRLGAGNQRRYNISFTFETFPFPEGLTPNLPASSYVADLRAANIAEAASALERSRRAWLYPPELVELVSDVVPGIPPRLVAKSEEASHGLAKRGLTRLYNEKPTWLVDAHERLDRVVAAAYGWDWPVDDEEVLGRLMELNAKRIRA